MDENETPINGREQRSGGLRAAGARALRGAEERVIWPLEDAGRAAFDLVRRPFEWLLWVLQRGLVWPVQDRLDGLGRPARAAVAVAAAAAVVAVAGLGIGLVGSGSGGARTEPASELVAEPAPAIAAAPAEAPTPEPGAETLEGAAPSFKPDKPKAAKKKSGNGNGAGDGPVAAAEKQAATVSESGSAATDTISSSPAASASASAGASASASAEESSRPAGKKALAVAREFADAFVVYETGGEKSEVRKAFHASATKELARSLLRRPPRLPANVKVPKAKVVNVVAGPSHSGVYPVSVSLLRVGVTSELRLEMELLNGKRWRVTNVLG